MKLLCEVATNRTRSRSHTHSLSLYHTGAAAVLSCARLNCIYTVGSISPPQPIHSAGCSREFSKFAACFRLNLAWRAWSQFQMDILLSYLCECARGSTPFSYTRAVQSKSTAAVQMGLAQQQLYVIYNCRAWNYPQEWHGVNLREISPGAFSGNVVCAIACC